MSEKKMEKKLELNKQRKEVFTQAIEEAKKLKKSQKDQDLTCGKVVCSFKKKSSK